MPASKFAASERRLKKNGEHGKNRHALGDMMKTAPREE
jgi:hypothetical protein